MSFVRLFMKSWKYLPHTNIDYDLMKCYDLNPSQSKQDGGYHLVYKSTSGR